MLKDKNNSHKNVNTEKLIAEKELKSQKTHAPETTKSIVDSAIAEAKTDFNNKLQKERLNNRRWRVRVISITIVVIILAILIFIFRDVIWNFITDADFRTEELESVEQFGPLGKLIVGLVFVVQVLIFVIHYGPIAIVSGSLYGPWWTLLLSTLGSTVGVILVWFFAKKVGKKFIKNFVDVDSMTSSYSPTKVKRNIFALSSAMLFPGAPKAIFAYIAPFTGVKLWQFIIINAVCKAPMTLLNASLGYGLVSGHWLFTAITGGFSLLTSLIGFHFARKYNKILKLEEVSTVLENEES